MDEKVKRMLDIYSSNLRRMRKEKHMTLKELSAKTKIDIKHLEKVEKGETCNFTTITIFTIAQALKTPPHLFFKE